MQERRTVITEGHLFVVNGTTVCPSRARCDIRTGESYEDYVRRHCLDHELGTFDTLEDAERNLHCWCFYYASKHIYGNKSLTPDPFYETCEFIANWEWHQDDLDGALWDAENPLPIEQAKFRIPDAADRKPGEYRRMKEAEVPRGCQKTTLGFKYYTTWEHIRQYFLFHNVYFRVIGISATATLMSGSVDGLMSLWKRNRNIARLFGTTVEVQRGKSKVKKRLSIYGGKVHHGVVLRWTREPEDSSGMTAFSVLYGGIGTETTGLRADLYIFDDGQTKKNVNTHMQREKVKDAFVEFLKQLDPAGRMIVLNTRKHMADFGGEIKKPKWRSQFHILHRRLWWVDPDTGEKVFYYPYDGEGNIRFTEAEIEKLYVMEGERDFWSERMNWPFDPAKSLFQREYFQVLDPDHAPPEVRFGLGRELTEDERAELERLGVEIRGFVLCDPAGKEQQSEDGDETYIVGLRFDRYGSIYVTNLRAGQWDSNRVWDELLAAWMWNRGQLVDYEMPASELHVRNAYAAWAAEKSKGLNAPINMPIHFAHMPKSGKASRIEQMVPLMQAKKFFILGNAASAEEIDAYVQQWTFYGVAAHDDGPDATSRVLRFVAPPTYEELKEAEERRGAYRRDEEGVTKVSVAHLLGAIKVSKSAPKHWGMRGGRHVA